MTPHEQDTVDGGELWKRLLAAAERFGWKRYSVERCHERDWDCKWTEDGFADADGKYLISDSELYEPMARELVRIASLLG